MATDAIGEVPIPVLPGNAASAEIDDESIFECFVTVALQILKPNEVHSGNLEKGASLGTDCVITGSMVVRFATFGVSVLYNISLASICAYTMKGRFSCFVK